MISPLPDKKQIAELSKLLATSRNIVITCHTSPDGDALGSSLALYNLLVDMGKEAKVIVPDQFSDSLTELPGVKDVMIFTRYEKYACELIEAADLIFCLDYNSIKRVDRVGESILKSGARKVMIDHHLEPETFPDIVISHPEISSTSALLYKVICALGLARLINKQIGSCIYTGMMTDTGNFSYNSNTPELYAIVEHLVSVGVDKDAIYNKVINTCTFSRLKIMAYAIDRRMKVYHAHKAALITLTREELNRFHYRKGDTESLVNVPLKMEDVIYSFFLREEENYIKVSSRSKGRFPVNEVCSKYFNGGGHLNAAGGEYYGTMEECVRQFEKILDENDKYFEN